MRKKQNYKKRALLKKALSFVVAVAVTAGIPGTLYSFVPPVPTNAAEAAFDDSEIDASDVADLDTEGVAEETDKLTDEETVVDANSGDSEENRDESDEIDTSTDTAADSDDDEDELPASETVIPEETLVQDGTTSDEDESMHSDENLSLENDEAEGDAYEEQPLVLTAELEGATVTAEFTESAMIPAGTELRISRVERDEKLYEECRDKAQEWIESKYGKYLVFETSADNTEVNETEGDTEHAGFIPPSDEMTDEEAAVLPELDGAEMAAFALFDISFVYEEEEEIEPQDAVLVTLKFTDKEFEDEENLVLIHYTDAINVVPDQLFESNEKGEVEGQFTADAFSEYAVIALKSSEYVASSEEDAEKGDSKEEFLKDGELTAQIDDAVVTVKFSEAARIPVGTELIVRKIASDEAAYTERLEIAKGWIEAKYGKTDPQSPDTDRINGLEEDDGDLKKEAVEAVDGEDGDGDSSAETDPEAAVIGEMTDKEASVLPSIPETKMPEIAAFALFDISLVCNGVEIEPQEAVQVTLRFTDEEFSEKEDPVVIHFSDAKKTETEPIEVADEQDLKNGEGGLIEAFFSAESFSEYAVMAVRATYTVWFDGTDGMGTANSLVRGATNVSTTANGSGNTATVTLPTSAGSSTKYELNGWYDINSGNYYKPGETATVTQNTVFYAEWVQANYSPTPLSDVVSNQPDISSFVRTDVFDYNEIFNPYHGAVLSSSNVYANSHSETWRDSRDVSNGNDFLFTNWYHQQYYNNGGPLAFAQNLQLKRNKYDGAGDITTGIVSSTDDDLMADLFGRSDAPGKVYLGQGDMLYQYEDNPSSQRYGYYYYDSDKNAADYHEGNQRFYIYNSTQTIQGQGGDMYQSNKGFMPFEPGTSTIMQKTGQVNFWFGMQSTVDFFLPDNPGTGGNKATGGKDMEFYFSGDDDVWVFVDGILLLDLGGIHRKINGSINFSDGYVYVEGRRVSQIPESIRSGDHQLQFCYLERGSSWSNASIYFNIAPRYALELKKSDADHPEQLLEGAVFNVYADADCTIPAQLWTSKEAYDAGEESVSTFATGEGGTVSCYGLYASRTYYLKEVSSPPGYPDVSGRTIALQLNTNGDARIIEGADVASLTQDGATKKIDLSVTNKLPDTIDIPVKKNWYNQDGSQASGEGEISVELYQAAIDIPTGGGNSGTNPGGNTGAVLPVNIRTQFFRANVNGSNSDTSSLYPGDLETSAIVTQGGSLEITVDVTAGSAGIYSVTVNGKSITPISTSSPTGQECFIGGKWGNHPPRHAVYKIDPAEEAMDIRVTLIGYLEYGGNPWHPDTSYSMNISTETTEPAAPGTGGENPEDPQDPPEIPSVMPEGATLIRTTTLSDANDWSDVFKDLPARNEDGTKLFVYYVKEIYPDGYSTSYIGNGSIGGEITIFNVRLREISVKKEWKDFDNSPLTEGLPDEIHLKLTQFDDTENTSREILVTLTAADGWQKKWRSNSAELNEQDGHSYRYKVTEIETGNEYAVTYSDNNQSGINEGTIVVTNRRKAYSVSFVKKDVTNHDITLQGAEFSLYTDPECTEIVEAYDSDSEGAEKKTVFISGENGTFNIYGLRSGTYYLKELTAPSGYYPVDYPMEIVITDEVGGVVSVRGVRLIDGILTEVQGGAPMIEIVQGSIVSVHIYNNPLYELPSTGGGGTYPLTLFGTFAFFAALLSRKRRLTTSRNEKEE